MTILSRNEMIETLNGLRSWSGYDPLETTHPSITKVLGLLKAEQEDDREAFEHYSALTSPMYEALKAGITVVTSEGLVLTPDASPAASSTEGRV